MKFPQKNKQVVTIFLVILVGIILAILILYTGKPQVTGDESVHINDVQPSRDSRPKHGELGHNHEQDHLVPSIKQNPPHDEHQHSAQIQEVIRGPHGGRLLTRDDYSIEITIFEENRLPEFRVYTYQNGKLLNPDSSQISIELQRLGSKPQGFNFSKERNYLKGDAAVEEPHSFKVNVTAKHNDKNYHFTYDQVEARTQITDKQLMLNNIEVLTAAPATIKTVLKLQGEVQLNADKSVHVVPRIGGMVEAVAVNAGDTVQKGQVLAIISSQTIAELRSDLLVAEKRMELMRSSYEREKQLWEEKISAQQDYLQAQHDLQEAEINTRRLQQKLNTLGASERSKGLTRYELRSPIDGVITNKKISQGQVVSEVDSLYEISDLSTVWAEIIIYAKDVHAIKVGQQVTIKSASFEAETTGIISYVGALVGGASRTAMARVVLNNANRKWLPGLPVNVEVASDEVKVALAVSLEGLQTLQDRSVVFGRYGEYFEARPLVLGRRDNKHVEVLKGFHAGERYAAGNSYLIKADIGKAAATHEH